jgi:hypothetical protein
VAGGSGRGSSVVDCPQMQQPTAEDPRPVEVRGLKGVLLFKGV